MNRYLSILILTACISMLSMGIQAQTKAFPTAEGYGSMVSGGRGGKVVEVTTVEDATTPIEGSLRWALQQYPGEPITIVFKVSGVIALKGELRCKRNNYTIAGQTAPGDGICIRGDKVNFGGSTNLIIRHLRFRIGNDIKVDGKGSIGIENASDFIIDHCTFGWSGEENMTVYDNNRITIQWCIIHEGLYNTGHGKGNRGYGMQWGAQTATFHHNLLAHNYTRSPRFNGARSNDINVLIDYVNNVNYNWGKANSCYGSDIERTSHRVNFVNNYYKPGPARPGTNSSYFTQSSVSSSQGTQVALWYMNGNIMEGSANATKNTDNYLGLDASAYASKGKNVNDLKSATPFEIPYPVTTETAEQAYVSVLAGAGAFPRDAVDTRIVNEVETGTASASGTFGTAKGIIDNPDAVGGYPTYNTYNVPVDSDHDGMPDAWETANGLNPNDPTDGNKLTKSGYTLLEVYLNSLVGEAIALDFDKVSDYVVAQDGSGDFTSIQAAINACPDNERKFIFVKNGTYQEKIMIGSHSVVSSKLISLIGEDPLQTIITWDDYNGKSIVYDGRSVTSGTPQSATFTVNAVDFYAENITFQNTNTTKQAVALYNVADRQTFKNCRLIGYQDTHYQKKGRRSYYLNCYIEGATDYICSGGTSLFDYCTLHSLKNGSYITAPEDITAYVTDNGKRYYYGYIFRNCQLTSDENVVVYLGRPWQPTSSSIYLECKMKNIKPEGWSVWSGNTNHTTAFFAEYNSKDFSGNPIDISQRADWSCQLTKDEVDKYYTNEKIFSLQTGVYDPFAIVGLPAVPQEPAIQDNTLSWPEVPGAVRYIILKNDEEIGVTTTTSYIIPESDINGNKYTIKAVSMNGVLSGISAAAGANTAIPKAKLSSDQIYTINKILYLPANDKVEIYSIPGALLNTSSNHTQIDLSYLTPGTYLVKTTIKGVVYINKIIL